MTSPLGPSGEAPLPLVRGGIVEGAAFMLLASLAMAALGGVVRHLSAHVPPTEVVFWRSAVTGVVIAVWARGVGESLRPVNVRMHLVRGLVGVGSMTLYFQAVSRLPLGDAVLITYLSPLLVAVMSPWTTGERPSTRTWWALGIGLVGVALVVGPHGAADPLGVGMALLAAFFAADAYLAIRVLTRTDRPLAIVFWFSAIGAAVGLLAFVDGATPVDRWTLAWLCSTGGLGAVAQWSLTRAYAAAPAARVAVFAYATPVFAYVIGLMALAEVPGVTSVVGAAAVVLAGGIAAREEG